MGKIICAIFCGILAIGCLIISVMSFREKGFLFNNAYIWASKTERETMDKKPHYRQSAIVFALLAAVFVCIALECVLLADWLWLPVGALSGAALVYAIASSTKSTK